MDLVMTLRRYLALGVVALLVAAGCSSGGSDDIPASSDEVTTGEVGTLTDMDPSFDAGDLPGDFPGEMIPDSFSAGMYAELGTVRNINFASFSSFDDVVAEYVDKIGEDPLLVEGEERLAQWTVGSWSVSVLETTPTLIGFTTAE